ncbi:MAG: zinc ribbon domain-containing protein [Candidatus Izemoplasmatales bacterium]|jgi:uncharacterized membrane protein/ribosomal protein L32|nr:zinc ribbon domain-containing protein [Candidatus Izemoplasmatales bacterium]
MFCSNCGKQLVEGSKFCNGCGSQVSSNDQAVSDSKRKIIFDGKIHKCPNCGSRLDAFEHKCKDCGYELRGSNVANVVKEFADKIEKTKSVSKKNELISNFYIPNTKEDIYEFFILATSNLSTDVVCYESWKAKLEQTYHKARLSFGNTPEFNYIEKLYNKTMKQYNKKAFNRILKKGWKFILGFFLATLGLVLMVWGNFKGSESGDPDSPFHMLSLMAFFPFLFGIGMFFWGAEKKSSSKIEVEEDNEDEEDK